MPEEAVKTEGAAPETVATPETVETVETVVDPKEAPKAEETPSGEGEILIDPKEGGGEAPKEGSEKSSEPVEYDLQLPEGSYLTEADLERTTEIAKKWGLSNEEAQELLTERQQVIAGVHAQAQTEAAGWIDAVKKDPQLGGSKFAEVKQIAKRGAQKTASDKLVALMRETGLGNHVEVVRHFYEVGLLFKDDTIPTPDEQKPPAKKEKKTLGERLYSKKEKDKE